ncbi:LapA family protein [Paenibacillus sp. TRM 82003]|nr:LapA family protein [Paenibacillus sp. TRM 82003]
MKQQWMYISALVFALIIAIFSVVNVAPVPVDYVFGTAMFPLIMVILGSALAGAIVSGLFAVIRMVRLNRQIRMLKRELEAAKTELSEQQEAAKAAPPVTEPAEPSATASTPPPTTAGEDTK